MSDPSQIATFLLTCPELRAWLVIKGDHRESRVVEMWKGFPNHWSASVWLNPGQYHCRYYCGDDRHAVYHGPAQLNGEDEAGMDGLVSVKNTQIKASAIQILLVEDNTTTLAATAKLLGNDGYTVYPAEGYQSALQTAKNQRLDLAICDINLHDGDGCDLLRELQQLQPLKAIAVTGYTLPEETEHYRDAGFAVVLRKPTAHSELLSVISRLSSTFAVAAEASRTPT